MEGVCVSAPMHLLFDAVYWFQGRRWYFVVLNVALVHRVIPQILRPAQRLLQDNRTTCDVNYRSNLCDGETILDLFEIFYDWFTTYYLSAKYYDDRMTIPRILLIFHFIFSRHYSAVVMGAMASLITSLASVYSTVHPGVDQRKYQSSAPLAFVRGIHRRPVNSPHRWPVTQKMFPFDDVIMVYLSYDRGTTNV